MGFVLSPGGWAQGTRLSIDYFDIGVKDGINTPFNASNPVTRLLRGQQRRLDLGQLQPVRRHAACRRTSALAAMP